MNMRLIASAALATGVAFSGLAYAESDNMGFKVNGNVALTTDYRYRGISQSDEGPAVQGGFDVGHETGLYAGIWASSVDFGDTGGSTEVDYYAGFSGNIVENVSFDLGYIYYDYPQHDDSLELDFSEFYGSISFAGATLGVAYAPDYTLDFGSALYGYIDYAAALPFGLTLGLHFGYTDVGERDEDNAQYLGDGTYTDYSISLSKEFMGMNLGVAWVDTDVDDTDCATDILTADTVCDDSFVFTISKTN